MSNTACETGGRTGKSSWRRLSLTVLKVKKKDSRNNVKYVERLLWTRNLTCDIHSLFNLIPTTVSYEADSIIIPTLQTEAHGSKFLTPGHRARKQQSPQSDPELCDSKIQDLKHRLSGRRESQVL